jgi:hypothetical protein
VWGRVFDPSGRPGSTGPQRSATEACPGRSRCSHNPQAATRRDRSSEGAKECSPQRKPWVSGNDE